MTKALEIYTEMTTGLMPVRNVSELHTGDTVAFRRKDELTFSVTTLGARTNPQGTNYSTWMVAGSSREISLDGDRMEIYVIDRKGGIDEAKGTVIEASIINGYPLSPPVRLMFAMTSNGGKWLSSEVVHLNPDNEDGRDSFDSEEIDEWEEVLLP